MTQLSDKAAYPTSDASAGAPRESRLLGGLVTVPVEIVRPKRKSSEWLRMFLGAIAGVFVSSATVMLLVGACHHEIDARIPAFGYLQTLLGVYTLKTLLGAVTPWDSYKLWSRDAK